MQIEKANDRAYAMIERQKSQEDLEKEQQEKSGRLQRQQDLRFGLQEQMLQAAAGNDVWVDVCMGGQVRDSATHSNQQLFSGKTH